MYQFIYDKSGGYHLAFVGFAAALACVLVITLLVRPQRNPA